MKKYKGFLLFGIIISLLIPLIGVCEDKYEEKDFLMEFLQKTGATFLEGDINIGGTIIDRFIGEEEIIEIANVIRKELNIKREIITDENIEEDYYWEDIIVEDGFIQLIVQGFDYYDNLITFTLTSYEDESLAETSLFINLINKLQIVEINDIIIKIGSFFDEYHKPMNITNCIIGTFDGNINLKEKEKRILNITKAAKGKIVEKYNEDDILSFSIYTPYIENYIFTGNNKMNLNIALRYNEYENKTYIWIGTPIITIGY